MTDAGAYADQIVELILDAIDEQQGDVMKQIVYSRVLRALQEHPLYRPPKSQINKIEPMNDAEARIFANSTIPFGKHVNQHVWDVPLSYLCRLTDPSDWIKELKRYLANPQVRAEMGETYDSAE